ncbi:hypothetical protein RKE29_00710 [Streptomyces sp. B1866]|uniref:hypothetical protein n=1 Tax=Streptomyces sp. B1866 TaxID=3075431 RepID=UPI00288D4B5B|nr:hypothetical protein [Streptomyces sp. B1866]MDT3395187.1 hypothetical protein [Streptomyces sp. B1866]
MPVPLSADSHGTAGSPAAESLDRLPRPPAWSLLAAAALGCAVLWAASIWAATHLKADPALHTAALFGHLGALVVGFGAVLVIDYHGLLWLLGRHSLREVLALTHTLHRPVWAGTVGLLVTGVFLHPDLDSPLTRVKLLAVLAIALNGVAAAAVQRRISTLAGSRPPARLLLLGAAVAGVSQIGWWTAAVIGFLNSQT